MASASPSTSYGTGNNSFQFDVFINHRGPDVKKGIASHLYHRLLADGLRVFLDIEELQGGDNLTPQIEGAIKTASVHVAIFSPRYAESSWCLRELVQMLESGKTILPIFYNVSPSELRWTRGGDGLSSRALNVSLLIILLSIPLCILLSIQLAIPISILLCILFCRRNKNGMYARALRKLGKQTTLDSQTNRQKPRYDYDTLEKWRESLFVVSNISGFELSACNGDEGQLVQKVVEQIWKKVGKTLLNVAKHPTGVEDKVKDFERTVLSQQQSGKTAVVGIVGLGGVGKTTLAKELFNRYRSNYDRSCFLSDVRKIAAKCSLNLLQSTLLKDLAQSDVQISSTDEGIEKLKRHLSPSHRALIVFDDVDHVSQLDALFLPIKHTVHSASLILVTSRNKDLLKRSGIVKSFIYQQTRLNKEHSRELFCWHAFNHPHPCIGFEQVVEKFLDICDGLPLSLQVIGALLCYEDLKYWEEQLHKVSKNLPGDILSRLTISYDSLDEEESRYS
eukprot:PITA_34611